jgi:hypothetical protein
VRGAASNLRPYRDLWSPFFRVIIAIRSTYRHHLIDERICPDHMVGLHYGDGGALTAVGATHGTNRYLLTPADAAEGWVAMLGFRRAPYFLAVRLGVAFTLYDFGHSEPYSGLLERCRRS